MKTQQSEQAQVAKIIRQSIKAMGYEVTARSSSFSMGNSVDVTVYDLPPNVFKKINEEFDQYQYGHFDGMQDMYEYSNTRSDIPQTKYLHISNEYSDELKQSAWEIIRDQFVMHEGDSERPELLKDAQVCRICGEWAPALVYRMLAAQFDDNWSIGKEFWDKHGAKPKGKKATVTRINTASDSAATIEEHTHTKKGFQMFIVVLSDRVDRDTFSDLRAAAQSMGGWYSRQWGNTPGGFAFKDKDTAQQFIDSCLNGSNNTPPPTPDRSEKLKELADNLQPQIDSKLADRQENTPKRIAQANSARVEGYRLQRTQQALYRLAELHEAGEVPEILAQVTSKKDVYDCMGSELERISNGFHDYQVETGKPRDSDPLTVALWELLEAKTEEQKAKEELQRKITSLQFANIPGYFPTPQPVVNLMLDHAQLKGYESVLEPSAGSGAIVDSIPDDCLTVVFERNQTLCEILQGKGFDARPTDFMEQEPGKLQFDAVLMNPPFENLQDIDHVRHAYKFLKPGGRLVSVMSASPFFRSDRKSSEFRGWIESISAEVVDLPESSFKESGTGVNTKLLFINKD